jgi:hypothetical protein
VVVHLKTWSRHSAGEKRFERGMSRMRVWKKLSKERREKKWRREKRMKAKRRVTRSLFCLTETTPSASSEHKCIYLISFIGTCDYSVARVCVCVCVCRVTRILNFIYNVMLHSLTKLSAFILQTSEPTCKLFAKLYVLVSFEFRPTELRMKRQNVTFRHVSFFVNSYRLTCFLLVSEVPAEENV